MHLTRPTVRYFAAAIAATMAVIYFLIGLGVLDVGGTTEQKADLWIFGLVAGGAFLLGAVLLALFDRRWLWIVGVVFQVLVYFLYVNVASSRTPPFEVWGIVLRILELPLLISLVYLSVRPPEPSARSLSEI